MINQNFIRKRYAKEYPKDKIHSLIEFSIKSKFTINKNIQVYNIVLL